MAKTPATWPTWLARYGSYYESDADRQQGYIEYLREYTIVAQYLDTDEPIPYAPTMYPVTDNMRP